MINVEHLWLQPSFKCSLIKDTGKEFELWMGQVEQGYSNSIKITWACCRYSVATMHFIYLCVFSFGLSQIKMESVPLNEVVDQNTRAMASWALTLVTESFRRTDLIWIEMPCQNYTWIKLGQGTKYKIDNIHALMLLLCQL